MKYSWVEQYCLSKKGAQKEVKMEWEAILYRIGGKMFGLLGEDKQNRKIVTLKADPMESVGLRERYAAIVPGYYMNKSHWNSVLLEQELPESVLKKLIDQSYELVLTSLSQKMQKEIQSM